MITYKPWHLSEGRIVLPAPIALPKGDDVLCVTEPDVFGEWDGLILDAAKRRVGKDGYADAFPDLRAALLRAIDEDRETVASGEYYPEPPRYPVMRPRRVFLATGMPGRAKDLPMNYDAPADQFIWNRPNCILTLPCDSAATAERLLVESRDVRGLFGGVAVLATEEFDPMPFVGGRLYSCGCGFHATENELVFCGGQKYVCPKCEKRCEIIEGPVNLITTPNSRAG